jgi:UDP-N-acetylmuramate dehydrogenase
LESWLRTDLTQPVWMMMMQGSTLDLMILQAAFGERLQTAVPMARYTSARVGGPADALLVANGANDLAGILQVLWQLGVPYWVLGGGSNVLVSDGGLRGVVVINRARQTRFIQDSTPPTVWAESGTNFGALARQAAALGLSGLEWAAGIPGTLGGAVVGNAGAFGGDLSGNLLMAEILHPKGRENWPVERFEYAYRSSLLKREPGQRVVLSATLSLIQGKPEVVQARMEEFAERRHLTQPPGASMGSMFKNPPGEAAGRLIDRAGLKGMQIGEAQISPLHGNFFVNRGQATAADIAALLSLARTQVAEKFGIELELEVELLGDWEDSLQMARIR